MFKKNYTVTQTTVLSGKDAKALRALLCKKYPSLDDIACALLFPSKAGIFMSKVAGGAVVYGLEGGDPLFLDPTGFKDHVLPTVSVQGHEEENFGL